MKYSQISVYRNEKINESGKCISFQFTFKAHSWSLEILWNKSIKPFSNWPTTTSPTSQPTHSTQSLSGGFAGFELLLTLSPAFCQNVIPAGLACHAWTQNSSPWGFIGGLIKMHFIPKHFKLFTFGANGTLHKSQLLLFW